MDDVKNRLEQIGQIAKELANTIYITEGYGWQTIGNGVKTYQNAEQSYWKVEINKFAVCQFKEDPIEFCLTIDELNKLGKEAKLLQIELSKAEKRLPTVLEAKKKIKQRQIENLKKQMQELEQELADTEKL